MEDKKTIDQKKRAAVIAAVTAYIKSQEEMMAAMAASAAPAPEKVSKPLAPPSLWGISGRQDIMQHRNLMQFKAFHKVR